VSLRGAFMSSVAVQAIGPLCAFASVFAVARLGGASAQGQFAQVKAWVDLLVVLGSFGFPQSIVYVVNRLGASARGLAWIALAYALAFAPLAWAFTLAGAAHGWTGGIAGPEAALVPALAGTLLVLHGLWRGVYLTQRQGLGFALFTIAPAVALLAAVAVRAGQGPYAPLLLAAAVVPAAVGAAMTALALRAAPASVAAMPWRALFSNGSHVFAQAMLMALQPLVAYGLIRAAGGGDAQVGLFNAGVFLVQGLVVPIGLVSPLLFARWTASQDAGLPARLHAQGRRWLGFGALAGLAAAAASFVAVPLVFGAGYRAACGAVAAMMLTLPLAAYARLLAPALHAHGWPAVNTVAAGVRLASLATIAWVLARTPLGALLATAAGWACSEALALAWTLRALARAVSGQPPGSTAQGLA